MKVPIPAHGQRGYKVDVETGAVHLRYAAHAASLPRTATPRGVLNLLGVRKPKACKECFPHGMKQPPDLEARSGQRRRVDAG